MKSILFVWLALGAVMAWGGFAFGAGFGLSIKWVVN